MSKGAEADLGNVMTINRDSAALHVDKTEELMQ